MSGRETKFRAWDIIGKRWISEFYIEPDGRPFQINLNDMNILHIGGVELIQFTGLKDKNGVEIYEGDIVTDSQISTPQVVYFREGAFMIGHRGEETQYDKASKLWGDYCEVIGNIYENKELLK